MIWLARTRVAAISPARHSVWPSASGRDGRIGYIDRCGVSRGPPIAAALPVGLGSGSGLLTRPTSVARGRPNGATRHAQCDQVRAHVVRTGRPRKPGPRPEGGETPRSNLGREADPKQGRQCWRGSPAAGGHTSSTPQSKDRQCSCVRVWLPGESGGRELVALQWCLSWKLLGGKTGGALAALFSRMPQDLVFHRDLQIFFAPGPRGADRILERHHLTGVSGGRPSAARPAPFLPRRSGLREATRPFWHPGNVSGPQRPHNARGSRRPRICRGSSNASPLVPT